MNPHSKENQNLIVSLIGLFTIDIVLLAALFAQVDPHPPGFLGPFIGAMISLGVISVVLALWERKIGLITAIVFGCLNILAVGPQKFFYDPNAMSVVPVIILANKTDLKDEREVKIAEAKEFIKKLNEKTKEHSIENFFLETSAKTGLNIDKAFQILGQYIVDRFSSDEEED